MVHRVCPWWLGYFLVSPLLRRGQNPATLLAPHVHTGQTVFEPGPGMGFFTPELARLVGSSGRVIAVDIQPKMLDRLKRRAAKLGLLERIDVRLASVESMGISDLAGAIDFTLAFAVVHELPDARRFFEEAAAASKRGATLLFAEPRGHVTEAEFAGELEFASQAGFQVVDQPTIKRCRAALLKKS